MIRISLAGIMKTKCPDITPFQNWANFARIKYTYINLQKENYRLCFYIYQSLMENEKYTRFFNK
jgi:hypothetical protein